MHKTKNKNKKEYLNRQSNSPKQNRLNQTVA